MLIFVFFFVAVFLFVLVAYYVSKPTGGFNDLGVFKVYPKVGLPVEMIDTYRELKAQLQKEHDSDSEYWMSQLPQQAKDMLKYRLMQRAIADMARLHKVDADSRGYGRLFSKGMVPQSLWNSVMDAERELMAELENVKAEAFAIEPHADPQRLIGEAMQIAMRYGFRNGQEGGIDIDAIHDLVKKLPGPGTQPAPMGMGPRPMGPMGPRPMGMRPPFPGAQPQAPMPQGKVQGGAENYEWKQDADELEISISLPNNAEKRDIKVSFAAKSLKVVHAGSSIVEGKLAGVCSSEGSTWTMSRGRLIVSLEKASAQPWPSLFQESPE